MKTVRNLLYRDVLWSVFFVTIFFVALVGLHGIAFVVGIGLIWWREHATVIHPLKLLLGRGNR